MIELVVFACGIVFGLGLAGASSRDLARRLRSLSGMKEKPAVPAASPGPTAAHSPGPTAAHVTVAATARLQQLIAPLDKAFAACAHPADLALYPAFQEAVNLLADPGVTLDVVLQYCSGSNAALACAAFAAIAVRADVDAAAPRVIAIIGDAGLWPLHHALHAIAAAKRPWPIGITLARARGWWADNAMANASVRSFIEEASRAGAVAGFGGSLSPRLDLPALHAVLQRIAHPATAALADEFQRWQLTTVNRDALAGVGRLWDPRSVEQPLVEFDFLSQPLLLAHAALTATPPACVLIVGEARVGKTSLIRLLGLKLAAEGYTLFEAGAADIMAGQKFIGQIEERVRLLIRELQTSKRVLWYVPDVLGMVIAGIHQGQSASVLDQILPAIAAHELLIVSEATPAALVRLTQLKPATRTAFQTIRLASPTAAEIDAATHGFGAALAAAAQIGIDADAIGAALQLSKQYLNANQSAGGALDFLKLAAARAVSLGAAAVDRPALLQTLSEASGLPVSILDEGEAIELAAMRGFFGARVMGQDAAVEAVVGRIAMLKAGLTDPSRPIGVYLFAGPTGTGKTELAKTLAEYLFGSAERLVRLDMSEFQNPESARKILGHSGMSEPGAGEAAESLTGRIRKQPFSVVLLDEFEKAHANVWDLFLQVFDDGRLTDSAGHTVDFRHTFIILTTNLGATSHQSAHVGFSPASSDFNDAQVMRAIHQTFRPEFVNRLDRVLVFKPLGRDLMRGILKKELRRVLERRGLANREWAVEWESSAVEFLLDRGFSADMGARPLRRAIDQHFLAPLAATLVEHRFPEGDQFLFVRSDGAGIQIDFVDPDAETAAEGQDVAGARAIGLTAVPDPAADLSLGSIVLQATGSEAERQWLRSRVDTLAARLDDDAWRAQKDQLAQQMQARQFWERDERFAVLARYALLDRVKAAHETAQSLCGRLERSVRGGHYARPIASRLALQVYLVELGIADALEGRVEDALLLVEPVLDGADRAQAMDWCATLTRMYERWAAARHMQMATLGPGAPGVMAIGGFGAVRVLGREAGLHVLEPDDASGSARCVVRVRVAAEPAGPAVGAPRRAAQCLKALAAATVSANIVRRYRLGASPLARDAVAGWRTGRMDLLLEGHFDLLGDMRRL